MTQHTLNRLLAMACRHANIAITVLREEQCCSSNICSECREAEADDPGQATLSFAPMPAAKQQAAGTSQSKPAAAAAIPLSKLTSSNGKGRHSFFRARKLQRIVEPI